MTTGLLFDTIGFTQPTRRHVPDTSKAAHTALVPETQPRLSFTQADSLRLSGNRARVLAYLQQHGSATNVELSRPDVGGLGGVRRVWELTVMGYRITKAKEQGGTWRYTLEGM